MLYVHKIPEIWKLALEPMWEANFGANSFGFRPLRGTGDAIAKIHAHTRGLKRLYVFEGDFKSCFDTLRKSSEGVCQVRLAFLRSSKSFKIALASETEATNLPDLVLLCLDMIHNILKGHSLIL